jgi:hypothetical protein
LSEGDLMARPLGWDAHDLEVASDGTRKRSYRKLQSWYRETVLGAAYGTDSKGKPIGSLVAELEVEFQPDLNFLDSGIGVYADARIAEVQLSGGSIEVHRLRHNMLSSQPLCFNVFGALRDEPNLWSLLQRALGLDIASIELVECEWAPPKAEHLGDRTAFDAFVAYSTSAGERRFLGIETKYTEPFSAPEYLKPSYVSVTKNSGWFVPGAEKRLVKRPTNQLWRSAMLAASLEQKSGFDRGHVVVLHLDGDKNAYAAVDGLKEGLTDPARVRSLTYGQLISHAHGYPTIQDWTEKFRTRYLDLSPLEGTSVAAALESQPSFNRGRVFDGPSPSRRLIEAASWRLAAEMLRRYPERLTITQTDPTGVYDMLTLTDNHPSSVTERIDMNRPGSLWIWPKPSGPEWVWRGIWSEMAVVDDPREIVRRVSAQAGLPALKRLPSSTPSVVAARFVAAFLSAAVFGRESWRCVQPSTVGGLTSFPAFASKKAALEAGSDDEYWFVTDPAPRLALHFPTGTAWDEKGQGFDLLSMYRSKHRVWPVVSEVAGELLP